MFSLELLRKALKIQAKPVSLLARTRGITLPYVALYFCLIRCLSSDVRLDNNSMMAASSVPKVQEKDTRPRVNKKEDGG